MAKALRVLKSRLYEAKREEEHRKRSTERRTKIGSGDRSERIRTYNFPQNRLTDHRINQNFNLENVIAGNLDPVIDTLIECERQAEARRLRQPGVRDWVLGLGSWVLGLRTWGFGSHAPGDCLSPAIGALESSFILNPSSPAPNSNF